MESCSSSDRERDPSTPPSDFYTNVRPLSLSSVRCFPCRNKLPQVPESCLYYSSNTYCSLAYTNAWYSHVCSPDPFILPHQQVDKGAIKFVLSGANIMCPGLTSPGAKLFPAATDTVVVSFQLLYYILFSKTFFST